MHTHIIVHIDDDIDDLELIGAELKKHERVEVIQFTDAEEGLNAIDDLIKENRQPCLILLDINIPGLNGKDALIKIRNQPRLKEVPVTLFSTSTGSLDKKFAEKYNASFVTKPVNMNLLKNKVDAFIATCDMN